MTPDGISFMTKTTDRFWSKVDIGSREECWPWRAFSHKGYGKYRDGGKKLGRIDILSLFTTAFIRQS